MTTREYEEFLWWGRAHRLDLLLVLFMLAGGASVVLVFYAALSGRAGLLVVATAAHLLVTWLLGSGLWMPPACRAALGEAERDRDE
jgi:hypothetical protein